MALHRFLAAILLGVIPMSARAQSEEAADEAAAWEAWNRGEAERTLEIAVGLIAKNGDDPHAHLLRGLAQDALGDHDSDNSLARARELGAKDVKVIAALADLQVARFESWVGTDQDSQAGAARAEAESLIDAWSSLAPGSAEPALALSKLRKADGRRDEAIGILFAAIARDPLQDAPHTELWGYLGPELGYGQLAAFYEGLARVANDAKTVARSWNYSGQVWASSAEFRAAGFRGATAESTAGERIGKADAARVDYRRAIACMRLAGATDPEMKDNSDWFAARYLVEIEKLHGDLGDLAATIDAAEAARAALDPLLRAHPDDSALRSATEDLAFAVFTAVGGEAGNDRNDPEAHARYLRAMSASRDLWKWATAIAPDSATWWNNYGFVARECESFDESLAAYEKCIALAPDNVRFLNDTALILLDYLHRDLDRAQPMFEKAIALGEQQYPGAKDDAGREADLRSAWGDAMLNLGKLHTEKKEFDLAEKAFARLAELDGGRSDLAESRANLAIARGDAAALSRMVDDAIAKLATNSGAGEEDSARFTAFAIRRVIARDFESNGNAETKALLDRLDAALAPFRKKPAQ